LETLLETYEGEMRGSLSFSYFARGKRHLAIETGTYKSSRLSPSRSAMETTPKKTRPFYAITVTLQPRMCVYGYKRLVETLTTNYTTS